MMQMHLELIVDHVEILIVDRQQVLDELSVEYRRSLVTIANKVRQLL